MNARLALPLALTAALGCATAPAIGDLPVPLDPGPQMHPAATAPVPPPAAAFDAKAFAASLESPSECEASARRLRRSSPDQGWALLRACVERAPFARGPFVQLSLLTTGAWDEELQSRPDAPQLMTRLIAARGGDVEGDLSTLQKSRTPVFTLAAALKQPDVYKGRWLILRGALQELRSEGGAQAALIAESTLRGATREMEVGPKYRTEHQSSGSGSAEVRTTRFGDASARGNYSTQGSSSSSMVKKRFENEKASTGRSALGRLAKADPFMEPGKEFVFLGRFDGLRQGPEGEDPTPILTVVSYFAPSPLVVE